MKPTAFPAKILFILVLSACPIFSNAQNNQDATLIQSIFINPEDPEQEKHSLDARRLVQPAVIAEGIGVPSGMARESIKDVSKGAPSVFYERKEEGMQEPKAADQETSIALVREEGVGTAHSNTLSDKAPESNTIKKGAAALSVSIYDAWWTDPYDAEGDGYVQSATLNWDADVIGGTGSLNVYMELYYKASTSSDWTLVTKTATYTITDNSVSDAYHVNLHNISHGLYDWRIDIYQASLVFNGFYGPANDSDLKDWAMETAAEDVEATVYFEDFWWTDEIDGDGDGYFRSSNLNWNSSVTDGYSNLRVHYYLSYKPSTSTSWNIYTSTTSIDITGTKQSTLTFPTWLFNHGMYDWRIDVYRDGESSADDSFDPSDDSDLNDYPMEGELQDVEPSAQVYYSWWSYLVDEDGDGYLQSARLNWNSDVSDGYSTITVYENIYWKLSTSSSWNLLHTTSAHTIGDSNPNTYYIDLNTSFDHNLYDFRIDIFRTGQSSADDSLGPSDPVDLNDIEMEAAWQDVEPAAYIYNVHWDNEVDVDGDGFYRSSSLVWNAEVNDGHSSLNVNLDVYYKPSASGTWLAADAFAPQVLPGSTYGTYTTIFSSLDHNTYDFRIDVFQSGNTSADAIYMDAPVVNAYPLETAAQDVVGDATIAGADSICQGASATFTTSATDASSYIWEIPTGWVINSGQGSPSVVITAGSNSGNICVTPSNSDGTGTLTCHAVIVHALPGEASVEGSMTVCTGSIVGYTAKASNADSFAWTVPSDWTLNSGQGSSSISVTVGASSGNVCATPSNGWCDGVEGCLATTVLGKPDEATIQGEENVISGSTLIYSAVASGASYINWSVPAGWQILSGQGSDTIEVLVGDASGYVCAMARNDCAEGLGTCVSVTSHMLPGPVALSGTRLICKELTGTFYAESLYADSYTWTLSGNGTIDSGQGSYSVHITPGDSVATLCVTPFNSTGEGPQECIDLSTHTLPMMPPEIIGETDPIVNESYTYSVDLIPDAESYIWITSDGSIEDDTHEAAFIWSTPGKQYLSVKTRNECGDSEYMYLNVMVQESVTGLAEVKGNDLLIYPNPTSDYLTIKGQNEQLNASLVSLTDISGKVVYLHKIELDITNNEFVMDVSQMNPGIYIVSLKTTDLIVTKMLLIE